MRALFLIALGLGYAGAPPLVETRVENGVRVHRAMPASSDPREEASQAVTIRLDRSFGAKPYCASMDWRQSVSRAEWESRCGEYGYHRWYDRMIYRGY